MENRLESIGIVLEDGREINYKSEKIIKISEIDLSEKINLIDRTPCVYNSYKLYRWIKNQKKLPRKIYLPQKGGLGFFLIQAVNILGEFNQIEIEVVKNGSSYEEKNDNQEWGFGKVYDLKLDYMENYSQKYFLESDTSGDALVSVCISHYNHGRYLPETLEALSQNSYTNFEVIIIDSGSDEEHSINVFKEMEEKYKDKFDFYYYNNESLGKARNQASEIAKGKYLIFFDSDNIPNKDMIEKYVKGMKHSGCDCLTAHNLQFEENMKDLIFTPIGPNLAQGVFENCFGDAAFCIKKDVFHKLDGFTDCRLGLEDWEFLAKLSLNGYKQDVIPEICYKYRRNDFGMANSVNYYKSHHRVLNAYIENQPTYMKQLLTQFCIPVYNNGYKQYEEIDSTTNPIDRLYMGGVLISTIVNINKLIKRRSRIFKKIKKILTKKL